MTSAHPFAAALSLRGEPRSAAAEAADELVRQLQGPPDLAFVFFSPHFVDRADVLAAALCDRLGTERLLGCSGEAIAATGREIEDAPAVSLWGARLPGLKAELLRLNFERTSEGGMIEGWPDALLGEWPAGAFLVLLGEPFSFPADLLLERLNEDRPGVAVVGGMASGGHAPGANRLIHGRCALDQGAVAALAHGSLRLTTVVSQGCRPIGQPLVVTRAERNVIYELGGRPALLQLKSLFDQLPAREQALVQRGLHVGRVVSEYRERFEAGDFLVRNVVGIDADKGAVAVGDYIRTGQTVQFHIRDAESADAELRQLLAAQSPAAAALLFTCNGRGSRLFDQPDHDAAAIEQALGNIPLAGFFAQGELGPVSGQNFMHGFTASVALLRAT